MRSMLTARAKRLQRICVGAGAGIAVALLAPPAGAAVRAGDVAATRAYLHAYAAESTSEHSELAAIVAATEAKAAAIGGECPSALLYAPRDEAFAELGEEAISTLFFAGLEPESSLLERFAGAIGHLSWSNRRLTKLVRGEAAEEHTAATLALPDLCGDIAAWKASAYATLPQSAERSLNRFAAVESLSIVGAAEEERGTVIRRLLRAYEGPAERARAKRIEHAEEVVGNSIHAASLSARSKLAAALGVSAL